MQQEFKKEIDKAEILVEALGYMQKYEGDIVVIKYGGSAMTNEIIKKSVYNVGANPFPEKSWWGKLTTSQFGLDSILYRCGWDKRERKYQTKLGEVDVDELNFNPYVIDKDGKKIKTSVSEARTMKKNNKKAA